MKADILKPVERRPYRSWVEISREQIAMNYRAICRAVGEEAEVMPVVKADAYRHGAIEVSRVLEAEGARWLAVSNTEEGAALRDAGIRSRVLVMADFFSYTREILLSKELTPVLHSLQDIAELDSLAEKRGLANVPYHLKIDTGMGRLGVRAQSETVLQAVRSSKRLTLEGLMTHFASAANYESSQTAEQAEAFKSLLHFLCSAGVQIPYIHLSSTIPVAYGRKDFWAAGNNVSKVLVRPGHAIYGYVSPTRGPGIYQTIDVRPALAWRASILSIKDIPSGARVGYGGIYQAPRPMRIAILAAGYADGIPHRLSNRGQVIVRGRLAPILGAVSMDLTTIDASATPNLQVGDAATLLGSEGQVSIDAQQIARLAGTISYSVLCGIHARVKRIYL